MTSTTDTNQGSFGGVDHRERGVRATRLDNGLLILTLPRRETRGVALNLAVLAGSRDEDARTAGAAHLMEHMFFQGTPSRPNPDEVVRPFVSRGGMFNASTERELINFFAEVPATGLPAAIEVVGDVICSSTFAAEALHRVREVVVGELRRRANNPSMLASDAFHAAILEGHPACHSPGGSAENVRSISLEAIGDYRASRFRASNMVLGVVGRVSHEEVGAQAQSAFAALPDGDCAPRISAEPTPARSRRVDLRSGQTQAQVMLGFVTPGLRSDDRFAIRVSSAILGRVGRRLSRELREERALTYSVSVRYGALTDVGLLSIATGVEAERVDDVIEIILSAVQQLRDEPISEQELADARGFVEGRSILAEESNHAQAHRISVQDLLGVPMSILEYIRRIHRVGRDDVQRVANAYLDPAAATVAVVRP